MRQRCFASTPAAGSLSRASSQRAAKAAAQPKQPLNERQEGAEPERGGGGTWCCTAALHVLCSLLCSLPPEEVWMGHDFVMLVFNEALA